MHAFLVVLDLHCCSGFALAAVSGGYSLAVVCGLLIAAASFLHNTGSRACRPQWLWHVGSVVVASWALEHVFSSCGAWALLLQGLWDLPRSRIEPRSSALAGRFFATEPTGKPKR